MDSVTETLTELNSKGDGLRDQDGTPSGDAPPPESAPLTEPNRGRAWPAIGGLLSAAFALAIGELFSGLFSSVSSLVVAVGDVLVDKTPGAIARVSIDLLGSSQKTVLVWGITIVSLLVGSLIGVLARRRFGVGVAAFVGFGLIGGWAASRVPTSSAGLSWVAAIAAAVGGITLLHLFLRADRRVADATTDRAEVPNDRRSFVGIAGGAILATMVSALGGSSLRKRFAVDAAREEAAGRLAASGVTEPTPGPELAEPNATSPSGSFTIPASLDEEVDGISPLVVPNDDFYRIDTALVVPQVDPASWSMTIKGMVDNEVTFTYDDLLAMDLVEMPVTLSCVSNPIGGELVGNAIWTGVPLRALLDQAGIQAGAEQLTSRSVDGWSCGFPVDVLDDPDRVAMVALAMNGEPLPTSHGFPARLVISGLYGYVSATKWLAEIELTTWDGFDGYWIPRGWSKLGPVKTQSRIDVPSSNARLAAGRTPIAGVAWAPNTGITGVEVQVDDEPWVQAELPEEMTEHTWRQWVYYWDATPGQHTIRVRATDASGYTQVAERTAVAPDGATGHHNINVRVDGV